MKEVIMKVPSFSADYPKVPIYVADLVRCKECKYDGTWKCKWRNVMIPSFPSADDYCSFGEREDE